MNTTYNTFVMFRAVALTVTIALLMWAVGLPNLVAQAANVSSFSVTLTDSAPGAATDLIIEFTTPNGLADGDTLTVTLADFGGVSGITDSDVEIDVNGSPNTSFTFSSTATTLEFTADSTTIAGDATVEIRVGENTTSGANQVTNPGTTGSYAIQVDLEESDSGETRVAIVDTVEVTASVDTVFTFTVSGVGASETVNGETTSGASTATAIPFGTLTPGTASTTAQELSVTTNAANGFAVTVQTDGALMSTTGGEIQGFVEGSNTTTPTPWSAPTGLVTDELTWSHWGLTSDDGDLTFGASEFVAATNAPTVVFQHNGAADGTTQDIGTARVGYKIEITALQPAGNDYTTTLTYIATPVF